MATKKWTPTSGKLWKTAANWTEAGVPEAGDDVKFEESTENAELTNTAAKCRSLDAEKYKGTLSSTTASLSVGTSTEAPSKIALRFGPGMTASFGGSSGIKASSTATSSGTGEKYYLSGATLPLFEMSAGTATTNKAVLEEELKCAKLLVAKGTLNTNGQAVAVTELVQVGAAGALTLSGSTLTISQSSGTLFEVEAGGTIGAGSGTVSITNTATNEKRFKGGAATYDTLTVTADYLVVEGANTITTLNVNNAKVKFGELKATFATNKMTRTEGVAPVAGQEIKGAHIKPGTTILAEISANLFELSVSVEETVAIAENVEVFRAGLALAASVAQTVTNLATNGKSGEYAGLCSATPGTAAKLKKSSGTISTDWMRIKDITFEGGATFYAGANSVDLGGNSGILFQAAPSSPNAQSMIV